MKDLQDREQRLAVEAAECDLIANLATDPIKRTAFERLAREYRAMIERLQADMSGMEHKGHPDA
jgi:hypothetical protein